MAQQITIAEHIRRQRERARQWRKKAIKAGAIPDKPFNWASLEPPQSEEKPPAEDE